MPIDPPFIAPLGLPVSVKFYIQKGDIYVADMNAEQKGTFELNSLNLKQRSSRVSGDGEHKNRERMGQKLAGKRTNRVRA